MKYRLFITIIFILPLSLWGALRGDIKILEASENIKLNINNFAIDYLLLYKFPHKRYLKKELKKDLMLLSKNMQEVSQLTDDKKSKRLLRFFAYQFSTLEDILNKTPNEKASIEILDISESFIEGFNFISSKHIYNFSYEEQMLTNIKIMEERIKEISKYYLSLKIIGNDKNTEKKLEQSIKIFKEKFTKMNNYIYKDPNIIKTKQRIDSLWLISQSLINDKSENKLPMIIDTTSENIGQSLEILAIYHSKKQ